MRKRCAAASSSLFGFVGMRSLLGCGMWDERIRGSHHIFTKEGVEEILNLQPKQGKAKVYQVKQVREMLLKYQLGG
ncbi:MULTISPECIES: type II toxin-antitoxin system HicA family toxin [Aphanizomenon]|uniref:type II toxin-antitoxin system HicA family toxin n=2 Tax=Aphanizomenonaceae TaxID=1892259 RepID=UPI000A3E8F32|nr:MULTISPECIES: type II toxin-antitoxin system HicA family toxin [Aphanizomenon]